MSAENNAMAHAAEFRWHRGRPDLPEELSTLADLVALRDACDELIDVGVESALAATGSADQISAILGVPIDSLSSSASAPDRFDHEAVID